MDLARRLSTWARLSEPGGRSFLYQLFVGALLVVIFWLVDAFIDYLIFGGTSVFRFLSEPDADQIADLSLVLFLVSSLLLYSRRAHRIQARLEEALQQALEKAEREKAKLEGILEGMGEGVSIQDADLRVIYQNRAHQELLGRQVGELCYRAYRRREEACPDCHLVRSFSDGGIHRVELAPPNAFVDRYVEIIGSSVRDAEGRPLLGIEVVRDITARKLAEEETEALNAALTRQTDELQEVNRELEAFCLAISHDLRTPLTRIYSSAQELQGYAELLDDNGRFYVEMVNDGCVQMEGMIDALMVLCRVTEMELVSLPVRLDALARELAGQLQLSEPRRRVELKLAPQVEVVGDPQLLRIALENLLSNAWKYTRDVAEPVIELGSFTSDEGEEVVFLRDNGAGFDSSRSAELFQPFRRLHSSREFPGTGLGLATVRRIIRRHNGRVWGEGERGRGATFYFTLNG